MSWHPWLDLPFPDLRPGLLYPGDVESFAVREIPLYEPCGEGEHFYLEVEKRDIDTPALVWLLAATLGIRPDAVGWAGRKDRRATARQWLSLPRQATEPRLRELADLDPRFDILQARPHRNKLRLGHLRGNRFRLLLRGDADPAPLSLLLTELREQGMPNYFGPQRFGAAGDNHLRGRALLGPGGGGRRARGRGARFLAGAFQAALFNRICAERRPRPDQPRLMAGDLAWIHGKGAVFRVEDPALESARAEALEISPSGPLPGRRMTAPAGEAGALERSLLSAGGWEESMGKALTGGRRPLQVPLGESSLSAVPGGLQLEFFLPPGSYASVLLALLGIQPRSL